MKNKFWGSSIYLDRYLMDVQGLRSKDQKKSRFDISKYLASLYDDDPEEFMRRVVTQDEPWVHPFDPEAEKHYAIDHFHLYEI